MTCDATATQVEALFYRQDHIESFCRQIVSQFKKIQVLLALLMPDNPVKGGKIWMYSVDDLDRVTEALIANYESNIKKFYIRDSAQPGPAPPPLPALEVSARDQAGQAPSPQQAQPPVGKMRTKAPAGTVEAPSAQERQVPTGSSDAPNAKKPASDKSKETQAKKQGSDGAGAGPQAKKQGSDGAGAGPQAKKQGSDGAGAGSPSVENSTESVITVADRIKSIIGLLDNANTQEVVRILFPALMESVRNSSFCPPEKDIKAIFESYMLAINRLRMLGKVSYQRPSAEEMTGIYRAIDAMKVQTFEEYHDVLNSIICRIDHRKNPDIGQVGFAINHARAVLDQLMKHLVLADGKASDTTAAAASAASKGKDRSKASASSGESSNVNEASGSRSEAGTMPLKSKETAAEDRKKLERIIALDPTKYSEKITEYFMQECLHATTSKEINVIWLRLVLFCRSYPITYHYIKLERIAVKMITTFTGLYCNEMNGDHVVLQHKEVIDTLEEEWKRKDPAVVGCYNCFSELFANINLLAGAIHKESAYVLVVPLLAMLDQYIDERISRQYDPQGDGAGHAQEFEKAAGTSKTKQAGGATTKRKPEPPEADCVSTKKAKGGPAGGGKAGVSGGEKASGAADQAPKPPDAPRRVETPDAERGPAKKARAAQAGGDKAGVSGGEKASGASDQAPKQSKTPCKTLASAVRPAPSASPQYARSPDHSPPPEDDFDAKWERAQAQVLDMLAKGRARSQGGGGN